MSSAMLCLWCTAMNVIITNTVHIRGSHWMLFWGWCLRVLSFFMRRDCRQDISLQTAALRPLIYDVNDWGVSAALIIWPKEASSNTLPWRTWTGSCSCWSQDNLRSIAGWSSDGNSYTSATLTQVHTFVMLYNEYEIIRIGISQTNSD